MNKKSRSSRSGSSQKSSKKGHKRQNSAPSTKRSKKPRRKSNTIDEEDPNEGQNQFNILLTDGLKQPQIIDSNSKYPNGGIFGDQFNGYGLTS